MKKICLFIISLLLNILLIVSIGLSNEKRDTYFIIQNSNVKIFLLPFIEMFLLAIHYIFCHTLPLYIFRKDKKMFNVFRIIRGFYLFVSFGLLVNLIVNNDIFTMSPYNSTFYIVVLFYLLYMFIAVPIIENNVYKDLDLGVYFRDLKDNTIYSSLMIILIMIFNSFLYIFVLFRKNSASMGFIGFIISMVLFFIYCALSASLPYINFSHKYKNKRNYNYLMVSNKCFLIIFPIFNLYFLVCSQLYKSNRTILIICLVILSLVNLRTNFHVCREKFSESNRYQKQNKVNHDRKIADEEFYRKLRSGEFSKQTLAENNDEYNSVNIKSMSIKNDNHLNKKKTEVKEVYKLYNNDITVYKSNKHKDTWDLDVYDYEFVGRLYYKSNLGNEKSIYINEKLNDFSNAAEAEKHFKYIHQHKIEGEFESRDFDNHNIY